jgi:hypothetical protein
MDAFHNENETTPLWRIATFQNIVRFSSRLILALTAVLFCALPANGQPPSPETAAAFLSAVRL